MYEICLEFTIKTPKLHQCPRSGVFIVNYEYISHIVLLFPLFNCGAGLWIGNILTSTQTIDPAHMARASAITYNGQVLFVLSTNILTKSKVDAAERRPKKVTPFKSIKGANILCPNFFVPRAFSIGRIISELLRFVKKLTSLCDKFVGTNSNLLHPRQQLSTKILRRISIMKMASSK